MGDHTPTDEMKQFIDGLTPTERGIFADMIMRSLRGSWNNALPRAELLRHIGASGEMNFYNADGLSSAAETYIDRVNERGHSDGRYWRRIYEQADVDVTQLPRETVERLAARIPDDATWDYYRINDEFTE